MLMKIKAADLQPGDVVKFYNNYVVTLDKVEFLGQPENYVMLTYVSPDTGRKLVRFVKEHRRLVLV